MSIGHPTVEAQAAGASLACRAVRPETLLMHEAEVTSALANGAGPHPPEPSSRGGLLLGAAHGSREERAGSTAARPAPTRRAWWAKAPAGLAGLLGLALLGVGLRAWLLASRLGYLNADEANTSLQARELFRGHAWILVPGTPYGGNVEAWLDAPFAALLGLSGMRNKVEVGVLWLVAALVLARSVRHLGRGPVAAAFGTVWLPSAALVLLSTLDYPGYSVGLIATCGVVGLARLLIDHPTGAGGGRRLAGLPPPAWRMAATGALAGLAVWQHPLYGWVCATTLAAVVWRQRRQIVAVIVPLVAGGALALTPVLVTNIRNDLVSLRFRGPKVAPYPDRVHAWITDLYPRAVGAKWLGPRWVTGRFGEVLAIALLAVLVAACLAVLRWSPPSGKVAAGTLLLAPFAMTLLGNTAYTLDGRYAVMVLPAAGVALAHAAALLPHGWVQGVRVPVAVAAWAVLAVVVPFAGGVGSLDGRDRALDQLVAFLDANHVTAVRADYWVAYRVVVRTDERIAASPLDPIKFPRYEARVRQADVAAGGAGALVLETPQVAPYLAGSPPFDTYPLNGFPQFQGHQRFEVAQWTVFLPPTTATTPMGGG